MHRGLKVILSRSTTNYFTLNGLKIVPGVLGLDLNPGLVTEGKEILTFLLTWFMCVCVWGGEGEITYKSDTMTS